MPNYPEYSDELPMYNGEVIMMPEMNRKVLWEIQNIELKMLEELERICKKHNINYSLTGGTLIGAARHHDFVPWDDDIDIDLLYPDFQKLIKLLPEELSDEFEFVNYDEYGDYFCDFLPRIFYRNSDTVNSFSLDKGKTNIANDPRLNRIFIELYCLVDSKKGMTVKTQIFFTKTIYGLCMGHRYCKKPVTSYTPLQKAQTAVLEKIGKRIPLKTLFKLYKKNEKLVPFGKGDVYYKPCVPIPYQERNIFQKEWFDEYTHLDVRGRQIMVPKNYITILETLYTNWKELPPVKDRHPDHFDLDNCKIW